MIPKFRAWDKINECMCDVASIDFMTRVVELRHDIPFYQLPFSEVELMQSTGLYDSYGIGIFDGDIISELSEQGEDWANHILVEVVWHKAGFYGKEKGHEPEYPITEFVKGEVIGNIWENPELMEVAE